MPINEVECLFFRYSRLGVRVLKKLLDLLLISRTAVLGIVAVLSCIFMYGAIYTRYHISLHSMYPPGIPEMRALEHANKTFEGDDTLLVVAFEVDNVYSVKSMRYLSSLMDRLSNLPNALRVHSLLTMRNISSSDIIPVATKENRLNLEAVKSQIQILDPIRNQLIIKQLPQDKAGWAELERTVLADDKINGNLISADGKVLAAVVELAGGIDPLELGEKLRAELNPRLEKEEKKTGLKYYSASTPLALASYVNELERDKDWLMPVLVACTWFLFWILFRDKNTLILMCVVSALSVIWALGILNLFDIPLTAFTHMLPVFLILYSCSGVAQIVSRYNIARNGGMPHFDSVAWAYLQSGPACVLSCVTTAIGFASVAVINIPALREFGILGACGTLLVLFITLIITPIGLELLGRDTEVAQKEPSRRLFARIGAAAADNPVRTLAIGIIVCSLLMVKAGHLSQDSKMLEDLSADNPVVVAHEFVENRLCGVMPFQILFESEHDLLNDPRFFDCLIEVSERLRNDSTVGKISTIADLSGGAILVNGSVYRVDAKGAAIQLAVGMKPEEAHELLKSFVSLDGTTVRLLGRGKNVGSEKWSQMATNTTKMMDEVFKDIPSLRYTVTGSAILEAKGDAMLVESLAFNVFITIALIAMTIGVYTRSLTAGVWCVIPNIFPLIATLGLMAAAGWDLRIGNVTVFSIALGMAVDGTMHLLVAYKRAEKELGVLAAAHAALAEVATPIAAGTVAMAGGFVCLSLSRLSGIAEFGVLVATTLLLALLATLLIAPSCFRLMPHKHNEDV